MDTQGTTGGDLDAETQEPGQRTDMPRIAGACSQAQHGRESFGQLRAKVAAMEHQLYGHSRAGRVCSMTHENISAMHSRFAFLEAQIEIGHRKQEFKQLRRTRSVDSAARSAGTLRRSRSVEQFREHPLSSGGHTPLASAEGNFSPLEGARRLESQSARMLARELEKKLRAQPETESDEDDLGIQQRRMFRAHEEMHPPAGANADAGGQRAAILHRTRSLPSIHDRETKLERTCSAGERGSRSSLPSGKAEAISSSGSKDDSMHELRRASSAAEQADEVNVHRIDVDDMFKMIRRKSLLTKADNFFQHASMKCILSAADRLVDQLNYFLIAHLAKVPRDRLPQKIYETFKGMDVDDSGYLSKEEVSASFERLGKPLSDDELDKYMQSVDVDGNGQIDAFEFEHMTRCLLEVDCEVACPTCRFLHESAKQTDNWGLNRQAAVRALKTGASSSRLGTAASSARHAPSVGPLNPSKGEANRQGLGTAVSPTQVDVLQVDQGGEEQPEEQSSTVIQAAPKKKKRKNKKRVKAVWRNLDHDSTGDTAENALADADKCTSSLLSAPSSLSPMRRPSLRPSSLSPMRNPSQEPNMLAAASSLASLALPAKDKTGKARKQKRKGGNGANAASVARQPEGAEVGPWGREAENAQ